MVEISYINPQLAFGAAGLIGAGVRGVVAYVRAKREDAETPFEWGKFSDTLVAGVVAGLAFSTSLPSGWVPFIATAFAGAGMDTYFNKFGINFLELLHQFMGEKATARRTAMKRK